MSNPFVGEIRMFGGNFAPVGWAFCDGSLLSIAENEVLFVLIGTTYGGDGQSTFALPDLRGRVPIHQGQGPGLSNRTLGEITGTEAETITVNQLPAHSHALNASTAPANAGASPGNGVLATASATKLYGTVSGGSTMSPQMLPVLGGSQPHNNMAPFLAVNFIISLFGIFPSQA